MALSSDEATTRGGPGAIEPGTYAARLVRVVDLGVQQFEWNKETKRADQINVTFELMDEYLTDDDGNPDLDKPRVISSFLKLYKGAKKGHNVEYCQALDPTGEYKGHWGKMWEARLPCLVNIEVNENGRNNIASLSPPMKGQEFRECKVDAYIFDTSAPNREVWEKLPEFLQEQISSRIKPSEDPLTYGKSESEAVESQQGGNSVPDTGRNGASEAEESDVPW